jgi:hypothetical protein
MIRARLWRLTGVVLIETTAWPITVSAIGVRSNASACDGENSRPLNAVTRSSPARHPACASREMA